MLLPSYSPQLVSPSCMPSLTLVAPLEHHHIPIPTCTPMFSNLCGISYTLPNLHHPSHTISNPHSISYSQTPQSTLPNLHTTSTHITLTYPHDPHANFLIYATHMCTLPNTRDISSADPHIVPKCTASLVHSCILFQNHTRT